MQGPLKVKFLVFLQPKPQPYGDAVFFHGNELHEHASSLRYTFTAHLAI